MQHKIILLNTKWNKLKFWVHKEYKKDPDDFKKIILRTDINYWQGNFTRVRISVQMRI